MDLKKISFRFLLLTLALLFLAFNIYPEEELTEAEKANIVTEINSLFEMSIKAGESLDIKGITENVDDTLRAGFIDNGIYFSSFDNVMILFMNRIKGIDSQKMFIEDKKTTVLSSKIVLVSASGNSEARLSDGRIINGKFAWSLVYSKINNEWKIIHTHMSNPR
jgi:hypothetical protein